MVGQVLGVLEPTFITGAMTVAANSRLDRQTAVNWAGLRRAVRKQAGGAAFDIVLDLREYARPDDVIFQMGEVAAVLEAEAWTLLGFSAVARKRPELARAAVEEARRQGRRVGGVVEGGGPPPAGLDYVLLSYAHGGKFPVRHTAGPSGKGGPPAIIVVGAFDGPPGSGFAKGITPAERRLMVMRASRAQKDGLTFAYPVFGPMSGPDQAYNALRDEFMIDAVRRGLQARSAMR